MSKAEKKKDYKVGKGKPPKKTQFSSSNQPLDENGKHKGGRKKGLMNFKTNMNELNEEGFDVNRAIKKTMKWLLEQSMNGKLKPMEALAVIGDVDDRLNGKPAERSIEEMSKEEALAVLGEAGLNLPKKNGKKP